MTLSAFVTKYLTYILSAVLASTGSLFLWSHSHSSEYITANTHRIDLVAEVHRLDQGIQQAQSDLRQIRLNKTVILSSPSHDQPHLVQYRQELEDEKVDLTAKIERLKQTKLNLEQRQKGL